MATKNRTDLKSYFVKNAIPTEGNFADLIDSQLNQAQDGVFKPDGEALSVVAASGAQQRVLRLYASYPAPNPDWMISLNPAQDPTTRGGNNAGFGVTDGAGNTRLFVAAGSGLVGLGTNTPKFALDVVGGVQANGFRGRYDLVLNDYKTPNPASNVCLQSPPNDRDAWIYRDTADAASNWGIYHRQIDTPVAGLPTNSIGFVGGGSSKLQAYVNLGDGSGFFAGGLSVQGGITVHGYGMLTDPKEQFNCHFPFSNNDSYVSGNNIHLRGGAPANYDEILTATANPNSVTVAGTLLVNGAVRTPGGVIFEGAVAHIERDGALYRNVDGQCYITVDDNLYIRDASSGNSWAAHFDTNGGHLELKGILFTPRIQLGSKWVLSGVGDTQTNDDWLRLLGVNTTAYYGGLAASKLWSSDGHVQGSDLSLKSDIAPLSGALDKILALRGVTYRRRDLDDEAVRLGLIAQEVEQVFPELVSTGPAGERGIQYAGLVAPLIEAVKELHAKIVQLSNR